MSSSVVLLRWAVAFVALVWILKSCVVEAFFVPSESMSPTLHVHDYILVPKFVYGLRLPFSREALLVWGAPRRGDIVVFNRADDPDTQVEESHENLVKRVIGLENDLVEVSSGRVYINGRAIEESYAIGAHQGEGQQFGPVKVPPGEVFVLGDNRSQSRDSRFWSYPFVKHERIQGKVLVVYWSNFDAQRAGMVVR